jgi:hydrogenase maturation protease
MTLIAGLGSPHGDDQLGWVAIDLLRPRLPAGTTTLMIRDGLELIEYLHCHDAAVLIDASSPAGHPGSIRSFTWPCRELDRGVLWSSHGLGLIEVIELAEALGRLPRLVTILTIEAHDVSPGAPLGHHISRQLDRLVERILGDLAAID